MKREKQRNLPLFWQLLSAIMACWFVLLSVTMLITLSYSLRTFQDQVDSILMSTVETLGHNETIIQNVKQGAVDPQMADYLTSVITNTECLEYITIADRNSSRLYFIDPAYIGKPFEGGDQQRALMGEVYLSDATAGHFLQQHRAFHPIRDENGEVLGFVMASATYQRLDELRRDIFVTYTRLFLLVGAATLVLCSFLAMYLGRTLRGVASGDLIRMYLTQNDILNGLDEGLISFDNSGRVRLVNTAAARMLGQREDRLLGQNLDDLLRAEDGSSLRDRQHTAIQSNYPNILIKAIQLPNASLWARQVLILVDKSEVLHYAEELGGTRHMLNTLRANTHEFLNRLQIISGLLQMGHIEQAQQYIGTISANHEHITAPVIQRIRNTSVAALVLGKASHMRELNIDLILMNNSSLPERSRYLSTVELAKVVGNLMENAIEAANNTPAEHTRAVALQITEDEKGLLIMVSDSGPGIADRDLPHIYEQGFSTKASKGRGMGMALIKRIVDGHAGTIEVETEPGFGTTFTIILNQTRGGIV